MQGSYPARNAVEILGPDRDSDGTLPSHGPGCQPPDRPLVENRLDAILRAVRPSANADPVRSPSMRLTVVGSGTSQPQPETPASGPPDRDRIDRHPRRLRAGDHPRADGDPRSARARRDRDRPHARRPLHRPRLAALPPAVGRRAVAHVPVLLPPGGKARLDALATAISERPHFFDDAYSVLEYDPAHRIHIGDLTLGFVAGQHYVPAWGCLVTGPDGARIAISGDTGPATRSSRRPGARTSSSPRRRWPTRSSTIRAAAT